MLSDVEASVIFRGTITLHFFKDFHLATRPKTGQNHAKAMQKAPFPSRPGLPNELSRLLKMTLDSLKRGPAGVGAPVALRDLRGVEILHVIHLLDDHLDREAAALPGQVNCLEHAICLYMHVYGIIYVRYIYIFI